MFVKKANPRRKLVVESRTDFKGKTPTALQLVQAVLQDKDLSPKLAMQARLWVQLPRPRTHEELYYSDGSLRPWMFPVTDCYAENGKVVLTFTEPKYKAHAMSLMELKAKLLECYAKRNDLVSVRYASSRELDDAGDVTAVNVMTGKVHAGID